MSSTMNASQIGDTVLNDIDIEWGDDDLDDININELENILDNPLPKEAFETLRTNEQNIGFNNHAGSTWMYPSNMPLRSYQFGITHAALFKNTLVVLPTGLGKTFIAAVVMYNIYRWYPTGKVIFIAPTRPLVAQQINACKNIMPFPLQDTVELTGKLQREKRMACWREKRVFFATPQSLQADMLGQNEAMTDFPFQQVKLVVVDEAHRAKGRYAYVEVVQALHQRNKYFRVLALSATPGRTMEDVAEVIRNLFISHLEVRWDTSIDVMQYVHQRSIKTIVVQYGDQINRIREEMIKIIDPYMRQLIEADVISASHQNITKNYLIMEQKRFRERSIYQTHPQQSAVMSNFSICISLNHALELLERHGLRVFLNSFEDDEDGRPKFVLAMNPSLRNLVEQLRCELGPNPFDVSAHAMTNGQIAEMPKDLDFGHPKFEEARKCILAHFEQHTDSRAIIFCEYRESVVMIYRLLLQHVPLLKPKCFVGQGGTTGALRALSQKQQIQIMDDFRGGKSNILIATSVGEEGIDVGEVDLIVCFDINTSNPIRFVQRIGRTGRQRSGRVVMLVTEGKEQKMLRDVLANKDQTNKKLLRSSVVQHALYKNSPRMVPTEFDPECVHIHVKSRSPSIEQAKVPSKLKTATKTHRVTNKDKKKDKALKNTQDLRKFFQKHDLPIDDHDAADFEPFNAEMETPMKITQRSMERVERLFKHIQPCHTTNTQLMQTQPTVVETPTTSLAAKTTQCKLETQYLKKINKFLKSSTAANELLTDDNLLMYLQSNNCSKSSKMFMLQKSYLKVRNICEQMEILQALNVEEDVNEMSSHELDIRQTYKCILDLFENQTALQRFLEDAELDALAVKKRQRERASNISDWDMTRESYQRAKLQIFKGLDLQGASWDSFDYRQQALKQTKAYQDLLAKKSKSNDKQNNIVADSMVFDAKHSEVNSYLHTDDFEDLTLHSSAAVEDSKYCNQWETHQIGTKSTPINSAFERQKNCKISSKKRLETVQEPLMKSDDDDDVFLLPLENEANKMECNALSPSKHLGPTEDLLRTDKAIEASFMQRQQSTPLLHKMKPTEIEPSLQYELDLNFEQAFEEPFPEEIEISNKHKIQNLSGSSSKENAKPIKEKIGNKTATVSSLFEMLESKPVNSILTPKRSLIKITPKSNETKNTFLKTSTQITNKITPKSTPQSFNISTTSSTPSCQEISNKSIEATIFSSPKRFKTDVYNESPKNRPQTSTNPFEKSPSIFTTFTKGLQRLQSRRIMQKNSLTDKSIHSTTTKSGNNENSDLDSPLIRKRKQSAQHLKRKIIDSDTETDGGTSPTMLSSHNNNSDDDFEEVSLSVKSKHSLAKKPSKPLCRARLCEFFDDEAEKSGGSGHSDEDEAHEDTLGNFVCDSVIVADDDVDDSCEDEAPTATQMQAIYLQSVKSPNQNRRGGFKIPAPRSFDINDIYSQAVPTEPSHYGFDTFVVNEDETDNLSIAENTTLCPLEKAERILKEQRREAKRRRCAEPEIENPSRKRARKCYQISSSSSNSSDDEGGG